jgi:hypothetical protein
MTGFARALVIAITVAPSLALPDDAFACTCPGHLSPQSAQPYRQWLDSFDGVVFRGTVVSKAVVVDGRIATAEYTLKVDRVWKGVTASELVVRTAADEGMCGIPFVRGRAYLIAADPPERPTTNICTEGRRYTRDERAFTDALGPGSLLPDRNSN